MSLSLDRRFVHNTGFRLGLAKRKWSNAAYLKNARCNIAASGAINPSVGLFFDRDPCLVSISSVAASWHGSGSPPQGRFAFFMSQIWSHGVGRAPLNTRAWVLQEGFLSRRTFHFGAESIFFECHELEACETFPGGLPPAIFEYRFLSRFKGLINSRNPQWWEEICVFQGMVKDYRRLLGLRFNICRRQSNRIIRSRTGFSNE